MKMLLPQWINENTPDDKMLWKKALTDQTNFVRLRLAWFVQNNDVWVVSTHSSKSIKCPVYFFHLADGVRVWMRYNFHDWNVSVESDTPVTCDFMGAADDSDYHYCFCQGMEEWKFSPYSENNMRFTVCVSDHYDVYLFIRVLRHFTERKS